MELTWDVVGKVALTYGGIMRHCLDYGGLYAIDERLDAKQPTVEANVVQGATYNER